MASENCTSCNKANDRSSISLGGLHSALFLNARDGIVFFELTPRSSPRVVDANPSIYTILGYTNGEIPLDALAGILTSGGTNELVKTIASLTEGKSASLSICLNSKDGCGLLLSASIDLVKSEGKEFALVGIRDVTKQQREESVTKENEARFRVIFEKAPIGIMLEDKERRLIDCNLSLVEMTGMDKEDLLSKKQSDIVHQEDVEKDARLFDLLMAGRIDHYNVEKRFLTHDGRVIYGNLHVSSLRDENGSPKFALNMLSDITQRKRMEVEVLRTRDYYQSILDNMPTLMWRSNDQLMREFFNKAWLGFTGRTFNEEYGHGWMRGVHPDDIDRLMEAQERSFLTQENFEIEYRLLAFDNQYHWMIDMARPFYDSHGDFKGYVGYVHDNTRWRKMQEKYKQMQKQ